MKRSMPNLKYRLKKEAKKKANLLQRVVKKTLTGDITTQLCVDAKEVFKFLSILPKKTKIEVLRWRSEVWSPRQRLEVPKIMKDWGVQYARISRPCTEIEGIFKNSDPGHIKGAINEISKHYGLDPEKFVIRDVTLERNNGRVVFGICRKEIRLEKDRRMKVTVLGLEAISRDEKEKEEANSLLSELNPKKYVCKFVVTEKKAVICATMEE